MKLAIDGRPLVNPHSGIGRYVLEITKQIRRITDWEITLLTPAGTPQILSDVDQISIYRAGALKQAIDYHTVTPKYVLESRCDIFFAPRHHLPWTRLNSATVLTVHDLCWRLAPRTMKRATFLQERLVMPQSLRKADAIICVSNATRKSLLEYQEDLAANSNVIYEGASIRKSNVDEAPGTNYMLCVGTQEPRKNYQRLLQAIRLLAETPGAKPNLIIVGQRGWKLELKKTVSELAIEKYVKIIDGANDELLASLYEHCDFLVAPSLYEGFCLPIVEAMKFGKPIITSNNSAMPEIAGNAALLCDPYDPYDIARTIRALDQDPEKKTELSARALLRAEDFTWETAGDKTVEVLVRAMSIHTSTRRHVS